MRVRLLSYVIYELKFWDPERETIIDNILCTGIQPLITSQSDHPFSFASTDFHRDSYLQYEMVHEIAKYLHSSSVGHKVVLAHGVRKVYSWPANIESGLDREAQLEVRDYEGTNVQVNEAEFFSHIQINSVVISFKPDWPFRQVLADWVCDTHVAPALIICQTVDLTENIFPPQGTWNDNDPSSPFVQYMFHNCYVALHLLDKDVGHELGDLTMYIRKDLHFDRTLVEGWDSRFDRTLVEGRDSHFDSALVEGQE
jgi:hypothetical protein